jgi:hypothetical protein
MITSIYLKRWRLDPPLSELEGQVPSVLEGFPSEDPYDADSTYLKISNIKYLTSYKDYFVAVTNTLKYICRFEDEEKSQ